jgi:hypothetical protein
MLLLPLLMLQLRLSGSQVPHILPIISPKEWKLWLPLKYKALSVHIL